MERCFPQINLCKFLISNFKQKRRLKEASVGFQRKTYLEKYFSKMITTFYSLQGLERVLRLHRQKLRLRTLKKTLCGFLQNVLTQSQKTHKLVQAQSMRHQLLLIKSLNSWKCQMPELRKKNALYRILLAERNVKRKAASLQSLQTYLRYKSQKRSVDHFMFQAVQSISSKRYFSQWRAHLQRRIGLKVLDSVWAKYRLRELFHRVERKDQFEESTERHLQMFNQFKLLEFTFQGLRKNVQQKYLWQENSLKIAQELVPRYTKVMHLRLWRQVFKKNQWELRLAHFCLIQIKNVLLRKYLGVLKTNYLAKSRVKKSIACQRFRLASKCLTTLRSYAKSRSRCLRVFTQFSNQRALQQKESCFTLWLDEFKARNLIQGMVNNYELSLKKKAVQGLRDHMSFNRKFIKIKQTLAKLQDFHRAGIALKALKTHSENNLQVKERVKTVQKRSEQATLVLFYQAFKAYYADNAHIIKKRIAIKRHQAKVNLRQAWAQWSLRAEDRVLKVRVLKYLFRISGKVQRRQACRLWIGHANEGQRIEELGESANREREALEIRLALQRLRLNRQSRLFERGRTQQVTDYYKKKSQLQLFMRLQCATKLLQKRKTNFERAQRYSKWQLLRKSFCSFALHIQRVRSERFLSKALQDQLRILNAPSVFKQLKINQLRKKEKRIKNEFADGFTVEKIFSKIFKALYWNMIVRKDQRSKNQKSHSYWLGNVQQKAFYSIKLGAQHRQVMRQKRCILEKTIQNIDRKSLIQSTFLALSENKNNEKQRLVYIKLQLYLNEMQRVFNALSLWKQMRISLRARSKVVSDKRDKLNMKAVMTVWTRALNIEMKTQMLERQRTFNLKSVVLTALERNKNVQQMIRLNLTKRVIAYLKDGFAALYNNALRNKKLVIIERQLQLKSLIRTVEKTFMGLRYQCITQKNTRLMQTKISRGLQMKSFCGWKYQIMLQKTFNQYESLRNKRDLNFFFSHWYKAQNYLQDRRTIISKILANKHDLLLNGSFTHWKRFAFKQTYLELMHRYMAAPRQREVAARCLRTWKRYSRYRAKREGLHTQIQSLKNTYCAQRHLRLWIEAATQDGGSKLRMRIMSKKLQTVVDRLLAKKAFDRIQGYGKREEYIKQNLALMQQNQRESALIEYFGFWRNRLGGRQLSRLVKNQSNRKLISYCFTQLVAFTKLSIVQKQKNRGNLEAIMSVTTPPIHFALIETFLANGSKLNLNGQKIYYFLRFIEGVKASRQNSQDHFKAVHFHKYKLYLKYFYSLMNFATDSLQRTSQNQRAHGYYSYRTSVKVLRAFVFNTLKQRKNKNAQALYHSKLCSNTFSALYLNLEQAHQNVALKTKMMRLLKKKCRNIFETAFATWRAKFQHRIYQRQAIVQFRAFQNMKLMKVTFGLLSALCQQANQIKDMERRAYNYFAKKRHYKLLFLVIQALRQNAVKNKRFKNDSVDQELQALRFHAFNLLSNHLRAWRKEVQHNRKRHNRSKLYAIFSAWKFYIKERSLLKKYLRESNIMGVDPSLMSTTELKENYARATNIKSPIFGESLSSHGTPFRSEENNNQRIFNQIGEAPLIHGLGSAGGFNMMHSPQFTGIFQIQQQQEDLQATGNFSSIGSRVGGTSITHSSQNNRYSRL